MEIVIKVLIWVVILIISCFVGMVIGMIAGAFIIPAIVCGWLNGSNHSDTVVSSNDNI